MCLAHAMVTKVSHTVKPLNSGHIGGRTLVGCREVVPISEVDLLATPPIQSSIIGFNTRGVAYKTLNQQILIKHTLNGQKSTRQRSGQRATKCLKFDLILMICACSFGLCPLSEVILYRLLSFGGTLAICCLEQRGVRFSEVPNVLFLQEEQSGAWILSAVRRLSAFRRVRYQRFHCNGMVLLLLQYK